MGKSATVDEITTICRRKLECLLLMKPSHAYKQTQTLRQLLENISCGYLASVACSSSSYCVNMHRQGLHCGCLPRLTDCLNHSMGIENVHVILLVLEELSNGTEDENFVPESVCAVWLLGINSLIVFCVRFEHERRYHSRVSYVLQ